VPVALDAGRGSAVVPLPIAGTWTFRVTVRTSAVAEVVFTAPITIR